MKYVWDLHNKAFYTWNVCSCLYRLYRAGSVSLGIVDIFSHVRASLVAQLVKNLPAMQETQVRAVGQEDPLEKGMATHSSTLAWSIPRTEDLAGYSPRDRKELDTTVQLTFLCLSAMWYFAAGGCPVPYRVCNSIPDFFPGPPGSSALHPTHQLLATRIVFRHCGVLGRVGGWGPCDTTVSLSGWEPLIWGMFNV